MPSLISQLPRTAPAIPGDEVPATPLLRKLKAAFLALSLGALLAIHLPFLPIGVQALGHGVANVVGQEHRWNMFSADPRGTSLDFRAELVGTDGRVREWRIDRNGTDLSYYHWVKWMETAVLLPDEARLDGFAAWLASQSTVPVSEVIVYGEQRLGLAPGSPGEPAEEEVLGRFSAGSPS